MSVPDREADENVVFTGEMLSGKWDVPIISPPPRRGRTRFALLRRAHMYFKQLVKEDLGCASYMVGCLNAGECAVVDPRLDMVDDILELAAAKGMQVTSVIETHNHADHISGHGEIARRTGATIYVHELAN